MKEKLRQWNQDKFLFHTSITVVGTKVGDFFNFLYRLAVVRLLSVEEYGILNSLISFSLIFCQFVSPFQPALSKYLAQYVSRKEFGRARFVLQKAARDLGIFSIAVLIIFIVASGRFATYLQIENSSYMVMVGFLVVASIITAVPGAFLQGAQLFSALALIVPLSALLKLLTGVGLVYLGWSVSGALWGFILSPLFILASGAFIIVKYFVHLSPLKKKPDSVSMLPIYKYFVPTGLILGSFWALTNIDIILVKRFFSPLEAGYYSVAQMVGLIILFLPGAVPIVVFPKVASAQARNQASISYLRKGLLAVLFMCGLGTIFCGVVPALILKVLTGSTHPESLQLVIWFALAMSFYALALLVIFYHLATHNTKIVLPLLLLAGAEAASICGYHPSLKSVLQILLSYSVVTFLVSLLLVKSTPVRSSVGRD